MKTTLQFLLKHWFAMATLAATGLTAFAVGNVIVSPSTEKESPVQGQPAQVNITVQGTTAAVLKITPAPKASVFRVDPTDCAVARLGVSSGKVGDICTVVIERQLYSFIYGWGSTCASLNMTSPANTDDHLVVELRGEAFDFLVLPLSGKQGSYVDMFGVVDSRMQSCYLQPPDYN